MKKCSDFAFYMLFALLSALGLYVVSRISPLACWPIVPLCKWNFAPYANEVHSQSTRQTVFYTLCKWSLADSFLYTFDVSVKKHITPLCKWGCQTDSFLWPLQRWYAYHQKSTTNVINTTWREIVLNTN